MIDTKKKQISIILTVLTIIALGSTVMAAVNLYYEMPMSGTIPETASLTMYIDDTEWLNNTQVDFQTLTPGQPSQKDFDIENTGNSVLQVIFVVVGLPSSWDLTYSKNGTTVQPGNWLNGTIILTPSALSQPASYYWTAKIHIS